MTFKLLAVSILTLMFCGCFSHTKNDVTTAVNVTETQSVTESRFFLTEEENSDVLSHKAIDVNTPATTQTVAHDVL